MTVTLNVGLAPLIVTRSVLPSPTATSAGAATEVTSSLLFATAVDPEPVTTCELGIVMRCPFGAAAAVVGR